MDALPQWPALLSAAFYRPGPAPPTPTHTGSAHASYTLPLWYTQTQVLHDAADVGHHSNHGLIARDSLPHGVGVEEIFFQLVCVVLLFLQNVIYWCGISASCVQGEKTCTFVASGVSRLSHYRWSGWHLRVHVVSSALQAVSHLFLYGAPLAGDRGDQWAAVWISYIKGFRPANVVLETADVTGVWHWWWISKYSNCLGFFLNNGLTHATPPQPSGENTHSLPKDSAVVAMDLIDSIQPVCNFLEQGQRKQHSATDFYSLDFLDRE